MGDTQPEQLRQRFVAYLRETFGEEFLHWIDEPKGLQIGERVLYKLKGDKKAERKELSQQEVESVRREMVELAKRMGADDANVTFDPPVSSGLPYPRLIDLPGSSIIWDKYLEQYVESDDLLPSPDFSLEWAIGILQASETLLMYLDFTHPKVKAIFTASYDFDADFRREERANIRDRFKQFREKERELKTQIEKRADVMWAKILQIDTEPLRIAIKEAE